MSIPTVAAVIPTYGPKGVSLVNNVLGTLWRFHDPGITSVIVVDDGSSPEVHEAYAQVIAKYPSTRLLYQEVNGGFARTCNYGIVESPGETVIVLVNNDIQFISPSLIQIADYVAKHNIGVAGIRLLYPNRTIQHAGIVYVQPPEAPQGWFDHALRNEPSNHPIGNVTAHRLVTGAFYAIHPRTLRINGLLDERYGMAVEDVDYCLKTITADLPVVYNGCIEAIHMEGQTRGRTAEEKALPENVAAAEREAQGLAKLFDVWRGFDFGIFTWDDYKQASLQRQMQG